REDKEKREPSYTVGVNWYSQYGETVWRFLKKLKIEQPYDPAIPLLESQKTNLWLPGNKRGRDKLGDWIDIYTVL
uniref:Uncharacterized protein n=1 Tax=Moschus moschiferus TaxID=68415 RepID=A0A8C6D5V8_MOSMO